MPGRKGKQLCLITTEGQPCGGCIARRQECTFNLPPLRRHRKPGSGSPDPQQPTLTSPTPGNGASRGSTNILFGMTEGDPMDRARVEIPTGPVAPLNNHSLPMGWGSRDPGPSAQPNPTIRSTNDVPVSLPLSDTGYTLPGQNQVRNVFWIFEKHSDNGVTDLVYRL